MVAISNWYPNALKMEDMILSNNFQLIMASTKHLILISKDDFPTNNQIKERNMNGHKW